MVKLRDSCSLYGGSSPPPSRLLLIKKLVDLMIR